MLFFYIMRYKQSDPENPDNDRFVLAKVCRGEPRAAVVLAS